MEREGGREGQGDGWGEREGESKGRKVGIDYALGRQRASVEEWSVGGGGGQRGLMKGTSEEGTGRGMDSGMDEASGGGIGRGMEGSKGAREGNFKGGILRRAPASIFTNFPQRGRFH